jgi:hypothetical protein
MLYREIIAVCSEIHTKHINTQCGQDVEFLNVELPVHTNRRYIAEVHKLYSSLNIIQLNTSRRMRWGGYVACMGKNRNAYGILAKILEKKRQHGRQNNIKIDFQEIEENDVDRITSAQNRGKWRAAVKTVRKLWVP